MGFSVNGQCFGDEAAAMEHWRSIHGLGIVEMTLAHPLTGIPQPAQCFFTPEVWTGGGAATIDRYCTFPDGEYVQLPATGVQFPVCDYVTDAVTVEASLAVFAAALACLAVVWGGKQIYALLTHSRAD